MVYKRTSGNGTRSNDQHDFRRRDCVIGLLERKLHVLRNRACDEQSIGMAWRCNDLDAKPRQVEHNGSQHVYVGLATIAAPCTYLSQFQRATKQFEQLVVESPNPRLEISSHPKVIALSRCEAVQIGRAHV